MAKYPLLALITGLLLTTTNAFAANNPNSVSLEVSALSNQGSPSYPLTSAPNAWAGYGGAGLRFAHELATGLLFHGPSANDAISADLGLYYYRVADYLNVGDQYTVVPLLATARYSLRIFGALEPFVYSGLLHNFSQGALSNTRLALGGGTFVRFGESISLRADIGTDQLGAGVSVFF